MIITGSQRPGMRGAGKTHELAVNQVHPTLAGRLAEELRQKQEQHTHTSVSLLLTS